jgi:hypothetical protein
MQDGTLYRRPAEIEALIDEAEGAALDALRHRAGISRSSADGFLPLECLVHFIRDPGRRGDEQAMSALMPHLLNRCEAILKRGSRLATSRMRILSARKSWADSQSCSRRTVSRVPNSPNIPAKLTLSGRRSWTS